MPLTRLKPRRRQFPLPPFELTPLEFEPNNVLVLDEVIASIGPEPEGAESAPAPTAGELHAKIERHLRSVEVPESGPAEADAADELRAALAQLRQAVA